MAPGKETSLAPPCSNLRSFGSKCSVLKKVLMTLLGLSGPSQWFGARVIVPPCSLVYVSGVMQYKSKNFPKLSKYSSPNVMNICNFEHNTAWVLHRLPTRVSLLAAFQVSSCSFCATSMPAPRVFSALTCVCFANNKTFPTFNQLFFEG